MRWDVSQFSPYEKKKTGKRRSKSQSTAVSQCTLTQMARETTGKDKEENKQRKTWNKVWEVEERYR